MKSGSVAIVVALIAALAGVAKVWIEVDATKSAVQTNKTEIQKNKTAVELNEADVRKLGVSTLGPLEDGQKLCRAVWPGHFTDGLVVPRSWTADNCAAYASKVGGTEYWLGCIRPNSVEFGSPASSGPIQPAGKPATNCGW